MIAPDPGWAHGAPSVMAAFLASLVEFVEALTVILAVGSVRGWRDALAGVAAALTVLVVLVDLLGTTLLRIPLGRIQLVVGTLSLLFGLRWLRKAVLRSAGIIPLHDETAVFARQVEAMRGTAAAHRRFWDPIAFGATFQITMLEGTEVAFIVIAVGAGGGSLLLPASLGALAALLCVILLGVVIHRPLAKLPENSLKLFVGVLLSAFGSFWVGEGSGLVWPGADWSAVGLIGGFLLAARLAVMLCRSRRATRMTSAG